MPALARLGRESFCAAFAHLYDPADLDPFLEEVYAQGAVAEEVAGGRCIHRLAWDGDQLTGFCKLRYPSDYAQYTAASDPIALGQLYTDPELTGRGIGAALMDWSLFEAGSRGCDEMQLSVWSENFGAQRFYARYGFEKVADIHFWVGNHRDDEFLLVKRL